MYFTVFAGALKKVPTFFRLEIQKIEFQVCDGFFSLRDLQGSQEVVSSGKPSVSLSRCVPVSVLQSVCVSVRASVPPFSVFLPLLEVLFISLL